MDRSDPPLQGAVDPPTGKTEPTKPASGDGREPGRSVSGEGEGAVPAAPEPEQASELREGAADPPEPGEASEPREIAAVPPEPPWTIAHREAAAEPPTPEPASERQAWSEPEPAGKPREALAEPFAASAPGAAPPRAYRRTTPRALLTRLLTHWDGDEVKAIGVRAAKVAAIVFSAWLTVVLLLIVVYRFLNPPLSSLIVLQWLGGTSIEKEWVPIERMSPNLVRAVIVAEDGRFCEHWGIDFAEIAEAIRRTSGGVPRGASTITMQVAKNLFLWPAKSYVRKVIEVPLTYAIELWWPKRRILEVYLNIAEWGPGVFGAEAAAKAHFGRSAGGLSARQSAQLAVALPNPHVRKAGDPGPMTAHRASVIQRRAAAMQFAASCIAQGR